MALSESVVHQLRVVYVIVAFIIMLSINIWSYTQNFITNNFYNNQENVLFYPDPITFGIWGVVYAFALGYLVFQSREAQAKDETVEDSRPFIACAMICNCAWLLVFSKNVWIATLVIILTYTVALFCAYNRGQVFYYPNVNATASFEKQLCFYSFLSSNLSFVSFGTIVNVSLAFQYFGYQSNLKVDSIVASSLVLAYGLIASILCIYRTDYPFFVVSAWSIGGIIRRQSDPNSLYYKSDSVWLVAIVTEVIMTIALIYSIVKHFRLRKELEGKDEPSKTYEEL